MTSDPGEPRAGLGALLVAFGAAGACVALTYVHPALADMRPWIPGDPLPVISALAPRGHARVVEDSVAGLTVAVEEAAATDAGGEAAPEPAGDNGGNPANVGGMSTGAGVAGAAPVTAGAAVSPPVGAFGTGAAGLPNHPPGVPTALVDDDSRGMDPFYRALHRVAGGDGLARVAHYGDSTIAADGITSTVRARLQARFGDGGPGYLSAGMDPRWNMRSDVTIGRHGTWDTVSLLLGGGGGHYSYGGIVTTAAADAFLTIGSPKGADGNPVPMHHFELWYQSAPARGSWWASTDGRSVGQGTALGDGVSDRLLSVDAPGGYTKAAFGASGDPVTFYGAVLETKGPGVVWDALGVVGVGTRSFTQHSKKHLAAQVAQRRPDLIVVMLGGNEVGLPVLSQGTGAGYIPYYQDTLRRIRGGAPNSACLVVTPLDQGTREGGAPHTKPNLQRLVNAQRKIAATEGCAFWNAFAAMGGADAVVRWTATRPPLAWTDLVHLSGKGQHIIGDLLADAIEHGYDTWLATGGDTRPAPPPPGPPATDAPPP
jgi:lysophospholipase L1-like esterase